MTCAYSRVRCFMAFDGGPRLGSGRTASAHQTASNPASGVPSSMPATV